MLISIGGLPGSGKTTISRALRAEVGGLHVRIDTIEQAIVDAGISREELGPMGYAVGYAVAGDSLRQGFVVIAESVNPLAITRDAWRNIARAAGARCIEVEVVCSDPVVHEQRAASRVVDIAGLELPSWNAIQARTYEPWNRAHLVIDTATRPVKACVDEVLASMGA